jgi:multidrug efflux pump subunit AcrA (membrane-fusion protein)
MPASTDSSTTPSEITVPADAVIYDKDGKTWVYVVDGPRSFQREAVTVERVDGDSAILSSGPKPGVKVVTVGAQELLGAELGVAGE